MADRSVVREGLEVLHRSIEIAPVCLIAVGLMALLVATVRPAQQSAP